MICPHKNIESVGTKDVCADCGELVSVTSQPHNSYGNLVSDQTEMNINYVHNFEWNVHIGGLNIPTDGGPNRFHRWMQKVLMGIRWVKND